MKSAPPPLPAARRLDVTLAAAPDGFAFPVSYARLLPTEELPVISPKFWLIRREDAVGNWTRILKEQFPERALVPFAKDGASDDVYCFDGNDMSGDPIVVLIHSFTTPGWEYRGRWDNFESWLTEAIEAHEEWIRDEADESE